MMIGEKMNKNMNASEPDSDSTSENNHNNKFKLNRPTKNVGKQNKTIDLLKANNVYNFKVNDNCGYVFGDSRVSGVSKMF